MISSIILTKHDPFPRNIFIKNISDHFCIFLSDIKLLDSHTDDSSTLKSGTRSSRILLG